MLEHQSAFLDLLLRFEVLRFGEFTLKSGRKSPYFVNAGQLRTGEAIAALGDAYAAHVLHHGVRCDLVFGPSYKGVPLAVATAIGLARRGRDTAYAFDRKEAKDHGEGGVFVGSAPQAGQHVVVVDDVITSGQSIREAVELVRKAADDVVISGVVVAVDRQERGRGDATTLEELQTDLGVRVLPLLGIREVVLHLHGRTIDGRVLVDDARKAAIFDHLAAAGAR
jgi:orotate phosphoribosyltransferase